MDGVGKQAGVGGPVDGGRKMLTREEWDLVKLALDSQDRPVKLACDGYQVDLMLQRVGKMELGIIVYVYVNGYWKGVWLTQDCEERRRFMCPRTRSVYSVKMRKIASRMTKRQRKDLGFDFDLNAKATGYSPIWKSVGALRRHLIKNNGSIELVNREELVGWRQRMLDFTAAAGGVAEGAGDGDGSAQERRG